MIHNATRIIANTFEEKEITHYIEEFRLRGRDISAVSVPIPLRNGAPTVICMFASSDEDSDVAVRFYDIVNEAPEHKRKKLLQVCNKINCEFRNVKFVLTPSGDVNVEYDLPMYIPDEALGEIAYHTSRVLAKILSEHYQNLAKVLFCDEEKQKEKHRDSSIRSLIRDLIKLRENPVVIPADADGPQSEAPDEENKMASGMD